VLVLDEIQKLTGWSESVKRLWDEDQYVFHGGYPGAAPLICRGRDG